MPRKPNPNPLKTASVSLSEDTLEVAKRLGKGNISSGIQKAFESIVILDRAIKVIQAVKKEPERAIELVDKFLES